MYRSSLFLTAALVGTTVALVQPVTAKSASEIQSIARAVTVEIKLKQFKNGDNNGSGVIIDRKGNLYTLVTNSHVVCGVNTKKYQLCPSIPTTEIYSLDLADGQKYQIKSSNVKLLGNGLDLAIIQFRSDRNYAVAKVAALGSLKIDDEVYTAGFPFEQPGFTFAEGKAIAVVNKRLTGDKGGYTIAYNAPTLPGMSGGGVFDVNGQLIAIHGYGDKFRENTLTDEKFRVDSKIGLNRGIPIRWLVENLAEVGINVTYDLAGRRLARAQEPTTADEYFIAGFNKFVEPGDDVVAGRVQTIQEFSTAIRLSPKYQYAYFMRAYVYYYMKEFQKSLADYNQAILINPKLSLAYNNRAFLKADKLNDIQGALVDYKQAISLNPNEFFAYNNRAILKKDKLNDIQGALADYNQAILINPKYSEAYNNRAALKEDKLNDIQGALADYNQAIIINLNNSEAYHNRAILKEDKLNDIQGALADYNQAILTNPRFSTSYLGRANLKYTKLNNIQGALADYNQAILFNPKYSDAYYNRAVLKVEKLNDRAGAIQDFRQAAHLFREQGKTQYLQIAINQLKKLGVIE
jgi:tetratricopeptide (TPR) repeat protein